MKSSDELIVEHACRIIYKNVNKSTVVRQKARVTLTIENYITTSLLSFRYKIRIITFIDERISMNGIFPFSFYQIWRDDYLTWEPGQFKGVNRLQLSSNAIWKPDLSIYDM